MDKKFKYIIIVYIAIFIINNILIYIIKTNSPIVSIFLLCVTIFFGIGAILNTNGYNISVLCNLEKKLFTDKRTYNIFVIILYVLCILPTITHLIVAHQDGPRLIISENFLTNIVSATITAFLGRYIFNNLSDKYDELYKVKGGLINNIIVPSLQLVIFLAVYYVFIVGIRSEKYASIPLHLQMNTIFLFVNCYFGIFFTAYIFLTIKWTKCKNINFPFPVIHTFNAYLLAYLLSGFIDSTNFEVIIYGFSLAGISIVAALLYQIFKIKIENYIAEKDLRNIIITISSIFVLFILGLIPSWGKENLLFQIIWVVIILGTIVYFIYIYHFYDQS